MSNIGGVSTLVALIAQEVRARRRELQQASDSRQPHQDRRAIPLTEAQLSLRQRVALRIASVEPNDPDRYSKGLMIFLEAVLLEEFGSAMIEDPSFHGMLANVHSSMMKSETLAEPIRAAISALLDIGVQGL